MFADSLAKLELDAQRAIGYTFKCMGAGFWAFRQKNFREAIQAITMEVCVTHSFYVRVGGDTPYPPEDRNEL